MIRDIILALVVIISVYTDLTEQKILNKVVLPGVLLGFGVNIYYMGGPGLLFSGKGVLVGMGLLLIPFILGGMGAGDVKLLGAIGAIKGTQFVFNTFIGTALAGGLIAIIVIITRKKFLSTLKRIGIGLYIVFTSKNVNAIKNMEQDDEKGYFPYGLAISVGTLIAYMVRWGKW